MNYLTPISIFGFMNKNAFIDSSSPELSYWKVKSKKKLVKFASQLESIPDPVEQVSYMYLNIPTGNKGEFAIEQIESIIDDTFLRQNLNRKNHTDLFETVRKFDKSIYVESDVECVKKRFDDILQMIEEWRYSQKGGMKYGWVEHAGIDKACIKKYLEDNDFQDKVDFYLFIEKKTDKVIGYSMIEKKIYTNDEEIAEVPYLIRKCLVEGRRNITEYIDWRTFNETMQRNDLVKLIVNWGCSSGGVKWYKTHKWPIYRLEKKWFYTWKG